MMMDACKRCGAPVERRHSLIQEPWCPACRPAAQAEQAAVARRAEAIDLVLRRAIKAVPAGHWRPLFDSQGRQVGEAWTQDWEALRAAEEAALSDEGAILAAIQELAARMEDDE